MNNLTYKNYELVMTTKDSIKFNGECKKLNYLMENVEIGWLFEDFVRFVEQQLANNIIKNQFSIIVGDYILKVMESEGNKPWRGICEEVDFDWGGFIFLEDLVRRFREKIEEKESESEVIEYRGFELIIKREQVDNAWFVGKSTLREDWLVASSSKEYIHKCFRQDVDELITQEDLIYCIEKQQKFIRVEQQELEEFLREKDYSFYTYTIPNTEEKYRYAVHTEYQESFQKDKNSPFPKWAVVRIW